MKKPEFEVEVSFGPSYDIWMASYFMAGLIKLAGQRRIRLAAMSKHQRLAIGEDASRYTLCALRCRDVAGGRETTVCFELSDHCNSWSQWGLENADVYFKRSYDSHQVSLLDDDKQTKIRRMNPIFGVWDWGVAAWNVRSWMRIGQVLLGALSDPAKFARAKEEAKLMMTLADTGLYECSVEGPKTNRVLFKTRVYDPGREGGDWVHDYNEERTGLVRALKEALGEQFSGGLVRSRYSCYKYPDLVAERSYLRPEFIRMANRMLVSVHVRGLFDCTPFSLVECVAGSRCAVTHRPSHEYADPLVPGQHYLAFKTEKECIDICRRLLADRPLAERVRREGHDYYMNSIRPDTMMYRYLSQAMG